MSTGETAAAAILSAIGRTPKRAAVVTDIDGVLCVLTPNPADATVSGATREALAGLARHLGFTAALTGRRAGDARRLVGVLGIPYCGHYGAELLPPGTDALDVHDEWARWVAPVTDLGARAYADEKLQDLGVVLDNAGGGIAAFHYRSAPDQAEALFRLHRIEQQAKDLGMRVHWATGLMEIRPDVTMTKREGMLRLLKGRDLDTVVFIGDTRPDIDAFDCLRDLVAQGRLRRAVCIGVDSSYAPPELRRAADVMVDGPHGVETMLRSLDRTLHRRELHQRRAQRRTVRRHLHLGARVVKRHIQSPSAPRPHDPHLG